LVSFVEARRWVATRTTFAGVATASAA